MATNPGIQSRARAEVLSILGSRTPGSASDIDSSSLPYFNACLREVLRLNTPITSGVPRVCSNPVRLGDYAIPAHTSYIYNVFVIHHTETIWNDPFAFRPERYLTESGGRIPEAWSELGSCF
jgi:cytochrome P450